MAALFVTHSVYEAVFLSQRVLVMGDFNTAHAEIDLARPRDNRKNSGFLPAWMATATTRRSHRPTACRTTSRWPLVTGSKEPG